MKVIPWNGEPISAPGIYSGIGMDEYHAADLCVGPSVSSSQLRTLFTESPLSYWIYSPLNPNRLIQPPKEAYTLGRGAHHLVLGEADFIKHFVVQPETYETADGEVKPWSGNANICKAWKKAVTAAKQTILTPKQIEVIQGMAGVLPWQDGLDECGLKNSWVYAARLLEGLVEHSIIAQDRETGLWIKSRPDVIPLASLMFNDFKTTQDVSDAAIRRTLDDYRYDMQAQLADQCLQGAAEERFDSFGFVFAEKGVPHSIAVAELDASDLEEAEKDNRTALRTLARCIDTGKWPGPTGTRGDAACIRRSDWSRNLAAERRAALEQALEAA